MPKIAATPAGRRKAWNRFPPQSLQKEPTLLTPCFSSGHQNCDRRHFCVLNHPVCSNLLCQPYRTTCVAKSATFTQTEAPLNWLKTVIPGIKSPKGKLNAGSQQTSSRHAGVTRKASSCTTRISHPQQDRRAGCRACCSSDDCCPWDLGKGAQVSQKGKADRKH